MDKTIAYLFCVVIIGLPVAMILLTIIKFFIDFARLLFGWLDIDDFNSMWGGAGPDCTTMRLVTAKEV